MMIRRFFANLRVQSDPYTSHVHFHITDDGRRYPCDETRCNPLDAPLARYGFIATRNPGA